MPSMLFVPPVGVAASATFATSGGFAQSATSATFAGSTAGATGAVVLSSTLTVTGTLTASGALQVSGALTASTFQVSTAFGLGVSGVAQQAAIADPVTGVTSDPQARAAISAMLSALRTFGLISIA